MDQEILSIIWNEQSFQEPLAISEVWFSSAGPSGTEELCQGKLFQLRLNRRSDEVNTNPTDTIPQVDDRYDDLSSNAGVSCDIRR